MIKDLIKNTRSYRRFDSNHKISREELLEIVNMGRISSCGGNKQVLKYAVFNEQADLDKIFPYLKWAGSLKDWDGPTEEERPTGYIFVYRGEDVKGLADFDCGIASANMLLTAYEMGLGGCMFKSYGKVEEEYTFEGQSLMLVIALGKPVENVVLEDVKDGVTQYYRDEEKTHHVPKRTLEEVVLN